MHDTRKFIAMGASVALLVLSGCFDFDAALGTCDAIRCPNGTGGDEDGGVVVPADEPGIYVDPNNGLDGNEGTQRSPVKSLPVAVSKALATKVPVRLALGTYASDGGLELKNAVSIAGGYTIGDGGWVFKQDGSQRSQLSGGTIALTVRDLGDAGIKLERLIIQADSPTEPGAPSIGMRVVNSYGVALEQVSIRAGNGKDGAAGGAQAASGSAGGAGRDGVTPTTDAPNVRTRGGDAGYTDCGVPGKSLGGIGGGGGADGLVDGKVISRGEDGGSVSSSTLGGLGGLYVEAKDKSPGAYNGDDAQGGADGGMGDAGSSGGSGDGLGTLVSGTWVASKAKPGTVGSPGEGGAGGGGGGLLYFDPPGTPKNGGGGGGGGGGGCPGQGGTEGQGGGASISLLLIDSHVEMTGCQLVTGNGGNGGDGAPGGFGGKGGEGGNGGTPQSARVSGSDIRGGNGGKGGNGGQGGEGGAGGNGGGGPTIGIWCQGSTYGAPVSVQFGTRGQAGNNPKASRINGEQHDTYNCPP